jgi:hypothetical protein
MPGGLGQDLYRAAAWLPYCSRCAAGSSIDDRRAPDLARAELNGKAMKRPLRSFSVQVVNANVHVEIVTDRKKPHRYRIWADERHPDIHGIERHLRAGLSLAQSTFSKIGIGEYFDRSYVFIELPIPYHSNQYSAQEL